MKRGGDSSFTLYSDAPLFAGQSGQASYDYTCFALDSALTAERLKHERCVATKKEYECKLSLARLARASYTQDPGIDIYDGLPCEYPGDPACEGDTSCVCSSSRHLLFSIDDTPLSPPTLQPHPSPLRPKQCSCIV
mmetsp:Transcript_6488/g.10983  ORF Transcript_6488/g.10983 Transcript_6488/m.10983 type:complete len:136 (-) Transcript_6488:195-602(-)